MNRKVTDWESNCLQYSLNEHLLKGVSLNVATNTAIILLQIRTGSDNIKHDMARHVAHVGERNYYNIVAGTLQKNSHFQDVIYSNEITCQLISITLHQLQSARRGRC